MEACLRHEIRKIKKKGNCTFLSHSSDLFPSEVRVYSSQFGLYNLKLWVYILQFWEGKKSELQFWEKSSYFFIPWWKQEYHDNNSYKLAHSTAFKTNLITTKNNFVLLFVFEVTMSSYIIFANFVCCCWVFFHTKMLSFSPKHCCSHAYCGYTFETKYLLKYKLAPPLPY